MALPTSGIPAPFLEKRAASSRSPIPGDPQYGPFGIPNGPPLPDKPIIIKSQRWDEHFFPRPCILKPTSLETQDIWVQPSQAMCGCVDYTLTPTDKVWRVRPGQAILIPRPGLYNFYWPGGNTRKLTMHDIGQFWDSFAGDLVCGYDTTAPDTTTPIFATGNALWVYDAAVVAAIVAAIGAGNAASFACANVIVLVPGTAVQCPTLAVLAGYSVTIQALATNLGLVYPGNSAANAQAHLASLAPGASIRLKVQNLDAIWIDAAVANDGIVYVVEQ